MIETFKELHEEKEKACIEIWHKFGKDFIDASDLQIESQGDSTVFRITLSPTNDHQIEDANDIFFDNSHTISEIIIHDEEVKLSATEWLQAHPDPEHSLKLELNYKKSYEFSAGLQPLEEDGLALLVSY
ncbi:MAG: hypothetical protein AAGF06_03855 [Pseudomonadota bacterium]